MKRLLIIAAMAIIGLQYAAAQSDDNSTECGVWTSAEVKKKLAPGLSASVEGELRTTDGVGEIDRWALGAALAYKLCPYLKADVGYTYMQSHKGGTLTNSGNYEVERYWSPRHRLAAALTGKYNIGRFELSLRERYQWTHREAMTVSKYKVTNGKEKTKDISAKTTNMLRSRLQVAYNIRKSPFTPYLSCEFYHNLGEGCAIDKTRYTMGTDYRLSKHHALEGFLRYISNADDDEPGGAVLGVGYKYSF